MFLGCIFLPRFSKDGKFYRSKRLPSEDNYSFQPYEIICDENAYKYNKYSNILQSTTIVKFCSFNYFMNKLLYTFLKTISLQIYQNTHFTISTNINNPEFKYYNELYSTSNGKMSNGNNLSHIDMKLLSYMRIVL